MSATQKFRQQHIEISSLIAQITVLLDDESLCENAFEVWSKTRELHSKLTIHLLMEDEIVYSHLLTSSDDNLRGIAVTLQAEMGGLLKNAHSYKAKWATRNNVQKCPEDFIEDSKRFMDSIQKRISLENEKLFMVIESRSGRESN